MGFVQDLPKIHRAEPMREDRAMDLLVKGFTVRVPRGPMRYMIDGDVREHSGDSMQVRVGRPVRIVRV
jgi:hypothetical protein